MFKLELILLICAGCLLLTSADPKSRQLKKRRDTRFSKLPITILYESLCPDSRSFMFDLEESYAEIRDYVDITLVPFGKSRSMNNGAQFFCQHGPSECDGNRRQSCVLSQTTDQNLQVAFAICQMQQFQPGVTKCAKRAGLSPNIDDCLATNTGTLLQLQAERVTNKYQPSFVPTIIYNNNFNQRLQDSSINNFRDTVCVVLKSQGLIPASSNSCSNV